jgi:hypothetical protein
MEPFHVIRDALTGRQSDKWTWQTHKQRGVTLKRPTSSRLGSRLVWLLLYAHRHRSIFMGQLVTLINILTPANQLMVMGLKIWSLSNPGSDQRPFDHWNASLPTALTGPTMTWQRFVILPTRWNRPRRSKGARWRPTTRRYRLPREFLLAQLISECGHHCSLGRAMDLDHWQYILTASLLSKNNIHLSDNKWAVKWNENQYSSRRKKIIIIK